MTIRTIILFSIFILPLNPIISQSVDTTLNQTPNDTINYFKELEQHNIEFLKTHKKGLKHFGTDKFMLYIVNTFLEEYDSKIYSKLNKEEQIIYKKTRLKIDDNESINLISRQVFAESSSKSGRNTITFETSWLYGLMNQIQAIQASKNNLIKRANLKIVFPAIKSINPGLVTFADELMLDSINHNDYYYDLDVIHDYTSSFSYNFLILLLHEFSHLVNPDFNEISADSFAFAKFIQIVESDLIEHEQSGGNIPLGMSRKEATLNFLIYYEATLTYLGIEFSGKLNKNIASLIGILDRLEHLYLTIIKNNSQNASIEYLLAFTQRFTMLDQAKSSSILLASNFEKFETIYEKHPEDIDSFLTTLQMDPSDFCFRMSRQFLHKKDYAAAKEVLIIGTTINSSQAFYVELCWLLLAKTYELRFDEYVKAELCLTEAKRISTLMPEDYYINSLIELRLLLR